jgi:hypothetical protein
VIVFFPYLSKVKVSPGWESFAEHNRYFVRGLLIVLSLFFCIVVLSYVPGHILGTDRILVFRVLGFIWIGYSMYFAITNAKRSSKVLCPRCKGQFDGPRLRHDICKNCGLAAWSPLETHHTT